MLYLALPGIGELWPILVVLLLLFGAKKLPELARAMGSSINMFKKGLSDADKAEELEAAKQEKLEESSSSARAPEAAATPTSEREREGSTTQ